MGIGQNANVYIGIQGDKTTRAVDLLNLLATSAGVNNEVDTIESDALTGNRFKEAEDVVSIYPDGDFDVELTKDTLPYLLLLTGFYEEAAPVEQVTNLSEAAVTGATEIVVDSLKGIEVGGDLTLDDGTTTETVTVDSINEDTNTVTLTAGITSDYAIGDSVTVVGKYNHTMKVSNTLDYWGTAVVEMADEDRYDEFVGVKGNSLGLSITQKAYVTANMNILGIEGFRVNTLVSASDYVTNNVKDKRLVSLDTELSFNQEDFTSIVDDIDININNNIDGDDYAINSKFRRDLIAEQSDADVSLTTQFDKAVYNDNRDTLEEGKYVELNLNLTANIEVMLPRVILTEVNAPVDGPDKITVSMNGNIKLDNATNTIAIIDIVDDIATKYEDEFITVA